MTAEKVSGLSMKPGSFIVSSLNKGSVLFWGSTGSVILFSGNFSGEIVSVISSSSVNVLRVSKNACSQRWLFAF